ncbi:hypothetical protein [Urechidicola vernalis]|uniref:Outermembrane protein n=1 Tax=Urechidicola vernalis TaxID=3075600 RepID=A0ABU2Y1Q7_9FLAO|nr:hypothetical protein [Urechidicola sp. P050]MDT0552143.1 hypothetical protein [Urechidicola sp. P050]
MKKAFVLFVLLLSIPLIAQEKEKPERKGNKGQLYISWGWNRAHFSDSDIHFKGDNYDFVLRSVEGNDRLTPFKYEDYFQIDRITIPQTNFRLGYFFHDNYTVSIGIDHMKYVMKGYQYAPIDGTINAGTEFDGVYTGEEIRLTEDFLTFEHTDGLNYVNVEVNRFDNLNTLLNFDTDFMDVNLTEGLGAGIIYPKTNATLFGGERYDDFNVAGYGFSAKVGVNLTFWDHFFIQSDYKVGYIDMPNIMISNDESNGASQSFGFFQVNITFGARFQLFHKDSKQD